jgi:hypothetical protein
MGKKGRQLYLPENLSFVENPRKAGGGAGVKVKNLRSSKNRGKILRRLLLLLLLQYSVLGRHRIATWHSYGRLSYILATWLHF